jgi:two-component system, cell cycle sensor histidine kinase and response regulator CckA
MRPPIQTVEIAPLTFADSLQPGNARGLCLEFIFHATTIGIGICDLEGRILRSNPSLERMLGCRAEDLIGMTFDALKDSPDSGHDATLFDRLFSGEQDAYRVEGRYLHKDSRVVWGRHTLSVVRAQTGEAIALVGTIEDVSEWKLAQEQLIEAQKMEAIGQLVGSVAHDFNNLLTGVMLYCDLMIAETQNQKRLQGHASEIRLAAEHGAALIQQLLTIARKHVVEPKVLSLNDVVRLMSNLLTHLIGERIELEFNLDPMLWPVRLDATQAQQIILNLTLNAKDAMPGGGRIIVTTRNCDRYGGEGSNPRHIVSLSVCDNGCGIDAETQARLFEPFFTTKQEGKGNGLGLATVYRIVQDGGGSILVDSELGKGTRIEIALPGVINESALEPGRNASLRRTGT